MIIIRWLINAIALLIVARIVPGFSIASPYTALIVALVLGLVNCTIRPLILILTLPITILTLGIFSLVINALLLLLVASVVKGFSIDSFAAAFFASLLLGLISWLSNYLYKPAA